jgi:hypothetical protein
MDASILDLRYKMRDALNTLNRREKVWIFYHGKIKGEIIPSKAVSVVKTENHAIFGLAATNVDEDPAALVAQMRTTAARSSVPAVPVRGNGVYFTKQKSYTRWSYWYYGAAAESG